MGSWYEVYDAEVVQKRARRQVSHVVTGVAVSVSMGLALVPVAYLYAPSPALGLLVLCTAVVLSIAWATYRVLAMRSLMWCVKISVHRLVGYDYARRRTELAWTDVERVEVDREGLRVVGVPQRGRPGTVLFISSDFPDYVHLSHRVVEYAEAHRLPICLHGRPWQLLELGVLYPFLASVPVRERPPLRRPGVR